MRSSIRIGRLGAVCKRYGPGRLPKADRREVGAGYAGACAALAIALAYAHGMFLLDVLGTVDSWAIHWMWGVSAFAAVPIVVTTAFLAGALVWRLLPDFVPYYGAVAGLLATLTTYLVSLGLVFLYLLAYRFDAGAGIETVVWEAGVLALMVGYFAIILTGWLTLPVGCVSGAVYERVRTTASE